MKAAAKSLLSESVEEPLTSTATEAATLAAAHLAGSAETHADALPKAEGFWSRRGLDALGGVAGGSVAAGLNLLAGPSSVPSGPRNPLDFGDDSSQVYKQDDSETAHQAPNLRAALESLRQVQAADSIQPQDTDAAWPGSASAATAFTAPSFPAEALAKLTPFDGGNEHDVYQDPDDAESLLKVSNPGLSVQDGRRLSAPSPADYLTRWQLGNEALGDTAELAGVIDDPQGQRFVMRQRRVEAADPENPHPDRSLINRWLRAAGFEYQSGAWVRDADGLVLSDDHEGNFILSEHGVRPIDLHLTRSKSASGPVIPWARTQQKLREAGLDTSPPAVKESFTPAADPAQQAALTAALVQSGISADLAPRFLQHLPAQQLDYSSPETLQADVSDLLTQWRAAPATEDSSVAAPPQVREIGGRPTLIANQEADTALLTQLDAQAADAQARLDAGPKGLMDVVRRGGQVDVVYPGRSGSTTVSADAAGHTAISAAGKVNAPSRGRLQMSLSAAAQHRRVAAEQGLKRGPASSSNDAVTILKDYSLAPDEVTVERTDIPPNEPTASHVKTYYTVRNKQGGVSYIVHGSDNTVWINSQDQRSSTPQPAQGGDLVYQAAMTYAHNNGLVFRADPEGVKEIAQGRRLSQMLSSAIRHNSTAHLDPSQGRDAKGNPRHEAPGWRHENTPEATQHNINLLAQEEYRYVHNTLHNAGVDITKLHWNPQDDTVWDDTTKRRLSTQRFNEILQRLDPGRTGIGKTTLSRALVTQAAILPSRAKGSGGGTAPANSIQPWRGSDLPEGHGLFRLLTAGEKLHYSIRTTDGPRLSEVVTNTRAVAQQAARMLSRQFPGIVGPKLTFFTNPQALLASGYAGKDSFTAEEIAQMQDAEGFYDNDTGHTIIFTDSIEVRPGESERAAVARVILHERVGHDGFNTLYQSDPEFATQWDRISKDIPQAELDAIARDYPDLAADRRQLELEWLARAVEQRLHLKEGLAQRLWNALKAFFTRNPGGYAKHQWTHEATLMELITKAREAAQNGTALPTTAEGLRLQFSMGGSTVRHTEGQPFRVNNLGLRTLLTGSALPKAFHETVEATERQRRALDQVASQIGLDLKTAVEAHHKATGKPLAEVYDMVHQAMAGAPGINAVLLSADPVLQERARVARNFIDDLSIAIANTLPPGPQRNTLLLNQGAWLRRSYAAFDPASGWNFDNVMKAARDGKDLAGKPARDIVVKAAALICSQQGYTGQRDALGLPKPGSVLEADLRDLMDRDTFANVLTGSAEVRKNVSSLIARKEISAPIRALMGEETNPIKQFLSSTTFQVQFVQRHEQQLALRNIGLKGNLFSTQRGGVFTQEIPGTSERWSPLAGLWTTPQLWAALQKSNATEPGNELWSTMGKVTVLWPWTAELLRTPVL